MDRGRPLKPLEVSRGTREELESLSRSLSLAAGLVSRAQIVLLCADGFDNKAVAEEVGTSRQTVGKWRERFRTQGLMGLYDERRPGKPRSIEDDEVMVLLRRTLDTEPPDGSTHWSCRSMADTTAVSKSTVHRVWKAFNIQPHRQKHFKLSTDPFFVEKVHDIVGLYLNPPDNAMVGGQGLAAGGLQPHHRVSLHPGERKPLRDQRRGGNRMPARPPVTGADTEMLVAPGADHIGELQAWDLNAGERVWTREFDSQNWGPVLTTGGGLVFAGGTSDRYFRAFDAGTGEVLWQQRTNSGVIGVPSTYAIDGVQYIAVQSGWGVDAASMGRRIDGQRGTSNFVPQGGVVWVFALER